MCAFRPSSARISFAAARERRSILPELGWDLGYVFALGLIVLACVSLFLYFRRIGWL
jgi:hypothetical protein